MNPELEKAFSLLACLFEAEGPERECIEKQLDMLPFYAAAKDKNDWVFFRNKRQGGRGTPDFSFGGAEHAEIIHTEDNTVCYEAVAVKDEAGEYAGCLLAGSEIEHALTKIPFEKALSDKIRLSELVDKSPVITLMIIPNRDMDVIFASGNIEKLGYSRDRFYLSRLSWLDVVHPEDRSRFVSEVTRLVNISFRFSYKYRIITASGSIVHVQSDMTVMRDASGKPMYFEGTLTDISDQIALELAIKETTEQYDARLTAILDPEAGGNESKLLEILSPEVINSQFAHISEEYGVYFLLGDSGAGNIGSWIPAAAEGDPFEECMKRMDIPGLSGLPDKREKYRIVEHDGRQVGITGIYIGDNLAAVCSFCRDEDTGRMAFEAVCEIVSIVCESLSADCTQSIELMRQADKTHLIKKATDQDYREQVLVSRLIVKLYNSGSNDEIISDMLSLVGEHLRASHVYLYEPTLEGALQITHEWTQGDLLKMPAALRSISDPALLLNGSKEMIMLQDEGNEFLRLCGALSALHCPIYQNGKFRGIMGIAECILPREWRRDFQTSICKVISEAVLWKNSKMSAALMFSSLSSMLENINALVFVADSHSQRILFANSRLLKTIESGRDAAADDGSGESRTRFPGFLSSLIPHDSTGSEGEHLINGRWYKETLNRIDWTDGRKAHLICLFDIHDIKEQELKIEYSAYHDPLLGVYNRRRFELDLEQAVKHSRQQPGALILLDLDDFKYINDAYGHDKGDDVLRRFIAVIKPILGENVYRYGGDEFMALLRGIEPARLREIVNIIVHTLQSAVSDSDEDVMCTASVGVARYPQDGHVAHDILRSVDMAMYQAKQEGKGTAVFFTPNMETAAHKHMNLDQLLKKEVEGGCRNMTLFYQPMFHTSTDELFGVEALLRWNSPDVGLVMPDEFVNIAEMLGLMHKIGNIVLERAISDVVRMRESGLDIIVSVNLFNRQLQSTQFADSVLELLEKHRCAPSSLMLEMTERMTLYDHNRKYSQLSKLRKAGVLVCADDFGQGQSSSQHLREKLWNLVKIDCKGIRNIHLDQYMRTFVKTRVRIAHAAGVKVCAEGVENEEQRALLAAFECDFIQGYLLDYPISAENVLEKYALNVLSPIS